MLDIVFNTENNIDTRKQTFVPNDCVGILRKNQTLNVLPTVLLGYYINHAKKGSNFDAAKARFSIPQSKNLRR
jgi:hypothetical protein